MDAAQKPRGNGDVRRSRKGQQAAGVRYGTSPGRKPPRSKAAARTTPLMRIVPAFRASGDPAGCSDASLGKPALRTKTVRGDSTRPALRRGRGNRAGTERA